ncbi:MAG: glucose-1-phosphate adenylyltransferase [Bdellovibrionaceae bacterium]|nr:glucose-1-phosphate adenylyltransferase [Pseudobdellovibrionaceae bacterium]
MDARLVSPDRVISLILGGGAGTRLFPLTKERAKPAVPLAGKYRLVDIPISLCINSGFKRIFLLTQYLSSSLHRHVLQSYRFDDYEPRGFIEIMAATQSMDQFGWYQGTADAVRQNLQHLESHRHDLVLILSGDQLYRMDYRQMLAAHVASGAEVTVATIPVAREAASGFGIMQMDPDRRIVRFVEKPKEPEKLDSLRMPASTQAALGCNGGDELFLASMGIYVFNRDVLWRALEEKEHQDFGKHIIPRLIQSSRTFAHIYQGYWEDIGTIKAFYNANLDLTEPVPQFNFFDAESPIYSRARFLPPAKIENSRLDRVVLSDGCIINNAEINRSLLGVRSRVEEGVVIRDSILMGADFFESSRELREDSDRRRPCMGIGRNTQIIGAIVDKNTRIGRDVVITNEGKTEDEDHSLYHVRDGIVIIPKGTIIPDGTRI